MQPSCPSKIEGGLTQNQAGGSKPGPSGDVEVTASAGIPDSDPFSFRNGIKTDEELTTLRQRKKGKTLESYHRKQNEVRPLFFFLAVFLIVAPQQLIDNLLKPMAVHTQEAVDSANSARLSVWRNHSS